MSKTLTHDVHLLDGHKLYKHPDRIYQLLNDPLSTFPLYVEVSPLDVCNHHCVFCGLDFIENRGHKLHSTTLLECISEMALSGVKSVMFAGEGEPLLHSDLPEIVDASSKVLDCAVTTNGVYLTRERLSLLRSCKWIKISVDAGDKKTYADTHGCVDSTWNTLWSNIASAIEYKRKHSLSCTIGVQALALDSNLHSLPTLARLCASYHVDYLVIKPYSKHSKSINNLSYLGASLSTTVLDNLESILCKESKGLTRIIVRKDCVANAGKYTRCVSVPYLWAYVSSTGDVYGCSDKLGDSQFCYGNIYEESFKNIWLGTRRRACAKFMEEYNTRTECRPFCRMDACNRYLTSIGERGEHDNFI